MRAAVITKPGGPEVLAIREVEDPEPGPWDVLVRVEASALNRADILQRRGFYPAPPGVASDIPGLELSGTVAATGEHVTRFAVGDRVMGLVGGGACADLAVLHEREAIRVPAGLTATDAAAIPEAFVTAFDAIVLQGGLASGQWLMVDAVGSGVGTAAIQIARALGARSAGSSRTAEKLERCGPLGLDLAVVGTTDDLAKRAKAELGDGVAVALSLVGGAGVAAMVAAMRATGTIVLVGLLAGTQANLPLRDVLGKRLTIVGTVLRSRPIEEKIAVARAFEDRIVPLFEAHGTAPPRLHPVVDTVLPLDEIASAHTLVEQNATFGKVVLSHA